MSVLLLDATGNVLHRAATDAGLPTERPEGSTVIPEPPRVPGSVWIATLRAYVTPVAATAPAAPHLSVPQFRARWTWPERVAFEGATLVNAEMRAIANELAARIDGGVDPTSALMAVLSAHVRDAGIIDEARRLAITAPVGTYPGEAGYTAPAAPPTTAHA